jgi:hypothetical protein
MPQATWKNVTVRELERRRATTSCARGVRVAASRAHTWFQSRHALYATLRAGIEVVAALVLSPIYFEDLDAAFRRVANVRVTGLGVQGLFLAALAGASFVAVWS